MIRKVGTRPRAEAVLCASWTAPEKTEGSAKKCWATAAKIMAKCVTMNRRKIGTRIVTLSLIPRRLSTTRKARITSFEEKAKWWRCGGSNEKIWSTPEAADVEIVRT